MVLQHSSLDSDTFSLSGPLSLSAIQLQLQLKMITQRWDPPSWMIYAPFCHILVYTQLCSVSRHWEGLSSHQITQRQKKFQTFPVVNLAWEPWLSISYFSFYICSIWYCYTAVSSVTSVQSAYHCVRYEWAVSYSYTPHRHFHCSWLFLKINR